MANIIDTALGSDDFNTLVTAIEATDLVKILQRSGPFTVFAPTDAAFAKLPKGTVDKLLKDIPQLKKILTYHVVSGKVMASDVAQLQSATTLEGSALKIDTSRGVKINNSTVTIADIEADNGVIHAIDTVLIPAVLVPA